MKNGSFGFIFLQFCLIFIFIPIFHAENNEIAPSNCGKPRIAPQIFLSVRIVGGTEAKAHSWPWQVSIKYKGSHFCGGTLISKEIILTAAHCLINRDLKDLSIQAGRHSLLIREKWMQERTVKSVIIHEMYNVKEKENNDIALIRVAPFDLNDNISAVCLPSINSNNSGECYVTGWGETQGTGGDRILKQLKAPIINQNICRKPAIYGSYITDNMVCAGYIDGGEDACQGDSGGPLVCAIDELGPWILEGIVSFGAGCARPNKPGVYTRVSKLLTWIDDNIKIIQIEYDRRNLDKQIALTIFALMINLILLALCILIVGLMYKRYKKPAKESKPLL